MLRQHTIYSLLFRSLETFIIVLRMAHEEDIRRWLGINSAHAHQPHQPVLSCEHVMPPSGGGTQGGVEYEQWVTLPPPTSH